MFFRIFFWFLLFTLRFSSEGHLFSGFLTILRNYLAEVAIRKAQNDNDYREIGVLFDLLSKPFEQHLSMEKYTSEAPDWAQDLQVSCSS